MSLELKDRKILFLSESNHYYKYIEKQFLTYGFEIVKTDKHVFEKYISRVDEISGLIFDINNEKLIDLVKQSYIEYYFKPKFAFSTPGTSEFTKSRYNGAFDGIYLIVDYTHPVFNKKDIDKMLPLLNPSLNIDIND